MFVCYVYEWHVFCVRKHQPLVAAIDRLHCTVANFEKWWKVELMLVASQLIIEIYLVYNDRYTEKKTFKKIDGIISCHFDWRT
jgi:hypothetical protein